MSELLQIFLISLGIFFMLIAWGLISELKDKQTLYLGLSCWFMVSAAMTWLVVF